MASGLSVEQPLRRDSTRARSICRHSENRSHSRPETSRSAHHISAPVSEVPSLAHIYTAHRITRQTTTYRVLPQLRLHTTMDSYRLTATQVAAQIRAGHLTVEAYARSLLARIQERDPVVKAWAHLDVEYVLAQAKLLDAIPPEQRGPLHGVSVAVKDVIYTRDMPTRFNSPIYDGESRTPDAASVAILRHAGALLLGKTTTTEFAATTAGPQTCNPHTSSPSAPRTPGGSSSGSGAVVGDFQAAIALGTQTGGSTIRPGSFNGVYAFKPTWNSVTREGQKIYSLMLDTLGLYARSVEDLELLADCFHLEDDEPVGRGFSVKGARFAFCKTVLWPHVGPGTAAAMEKARHLLEAHGAVVEEIELPRSLDGLPAWHAAIMKSDGRTAFLPEYVVARDQLSDELSGHVENRTRLSRAAQLEAFDNIAAARPVVDKILKGYDAVVTPSVPDEAPEGTQSTGSAAFNLIWTVSTTPLVRGIIS